ncbi:MAG TPA: 2-oxoacid:ferredoxin oxidoreductase subunit beta [Hyphomicrobiaceae bacterium]|nr:2-oxoacid:ferredoxin oxidoreductase subunit beta [Hyphomicrobiaceae bacterium]
MSYIQKPTAYHPALPKNKLGYTRRDYEASMSTLCAGCGHDSITAAIIESCYSLNLPAHRIAKVSGIGCSSKAPTYFLGRSHGFNSVHGRMPSVTTGANLANRDLVYIGVSGDGDTASIGLGQFCHAVRRQLNMTYIVMNNGCYGLTKGQFSATNDKGSPSKKGEANPFEAIDLCQLAIQLGAGFVARSFSGDKKQLVPLIEAALAYNGFAFLDVLSPCVTFNNHTTSTKSYEYIRDHYQMMGRLDFVPQMEEITVDYDEGTSTNVTLHDGSLLKLHKFDEHGHDIRDADAALNAIRSQSNKGAVATGMLYINDAEQDLHDVLGTTDRPLNNLDMGLLCPGSKALEAINARLR